MKKTIYISALALVVVTLASCKKYLDIEPVGKVIPTTSADFRALMTKAYAMFPAHKSLLAVRTDELYLNPNSNGFPEKRDIYTWNDVSPDPITANFSYIEFYSTIFYANEVITDIDERAGKSDETAQIKGEAYLLRAYSHFELLNLYAKPYNPSTAASDRGIAVALKIDLENNYKPATVEEVYTQILADIAEGQKLLNVTNFESGKNYRFTKRAAFAFLARVYEFRGDWVNSLSAAQQALALNGSLEDLNSAGSLLPNNYLSKESIVSLENVNNADIVTSSFISDHLQGIYNKVDDLRFGLYFTKSGSNYVSAKGNSNALKVSFRNGELYLIQAEAALQSGNTALALKSLLDLKLNRLRPTYYTTEKVRISALAPADLLKEILMERERELALEGHRWYDLRRYGQPSITHNLDGKDFVLQNNDPRYTLRFPRSAVANNPNLQ